MLLRVKPISQMQLELNTSVRISRKIVPTAMDQVSKVQQLERLNLNLALDLKHKPIEFSDALKYKTLNSFLLLKDK